MPYISNTIPLTKSRWLLSGFSQSGKTTSLITFLYGEYDYWSDEEHAHAVEYATGQTMRIVTCPGEFGRRSLPLDTEQLKSYYYETTEGENTNDVKWSIEALKAFDSVVAQCKRDRPTILAYDGIPGLWEHLMNRATGGDYLAGIDLNINPSTGNTDTYRAARFYSQTHKAFSQYISDLYTGPYAIGIATTVEEWETGNSENPTRRAAKIGDTRYLWPAIPGAMAKQVVGKFDGRLSCQFKSQCLYGKNCEDSREGRAHFVWQFYPTEAVCGVGVKGLRRLTQPMKETPYIHQTYPSLQKLIGACQ